MRSSTTRARGFGHSCGGGPTRRPQRRLRAGIDPPGRHALRGARHPVPARPAGRPEASPSADAIGVTGISYGGGQSIELAYLRNRIRLPDGSFAPWTSPKGTALSITAAWPRWPWSDLAAALLPNGRFLDSQVAPPGQSIDPTGIEIASYVSGLFALGKSSGYYARRPGESDQPRRRPHDLDSRSSTRASRTAARRRPPIAADRRPPPGLRTVRARRRRCCIENGWTDDLFPPEHALRVYNQVAANAAPVSAAVRRPRPQPGHPTSRTVNRPFNAQGAAFFGAYLQGSGTPPAPAAVTAYTQTCPQSTPDGGPYSAPSWPALHPAPSRSAPAARADGQRRRRRSGDALGIRPDRAARATPARAITPQPAAGNRRLHTHRRAGSRCSGCRW